MKAINIGAQEFDRIRENNYFYIDKTFFIKEWWESADDVTLITRPRRFGKTLNMRMLECFFSNRYAGRTDLFEGLDIWEEEKYRQLQGTYPVIFLSFANVKEQTFGMAREAVVRTIQELFQGYKDLWSGDGEEASRRYAFMNIDSQSTDVEITRSLHDLCDYLEFRYKKRVLVFLDEYDTPLQEAFVNGYWEEMSAFMRSLFNSTFKTNPSMERAVMTGITRVSKESIFSDLNNLKVVTTTTKKYETAFGFTETEVFQTLNEFEMHDVCGQVKKWYDGFTFGTTSDIYNPWSILNFLDTGEFAPYWANTSSNGLISYELRCSDNVIKHQMEGLMNGGTVNAVIDEQIIFSQLNESSEAIWSLFLAGGYLRICNRKFDGRRYQYALALTNLEVEMMFEDLIAGWFKPTDSFTEFTDALIKRDTERTEYYLNDVLLNSAGSFDTRKKVQPGHEPESFYHGLVLGLVVTEKNYFVRSNRESGLGRYDVIMKPRRSGEKIPVVIIEFKVFDPNREKTLEETADRAIRQIKEKKYDTELIQEGFSKENILYYGMAFRGKRAVVKCR